jgi:hypothetical protein
MAFNPLHRFRKHQKLIFAGLTIVCMLTFVMAGSVTGGGDFLTELQRFIGTGPRGQDQARLFGKALNPADIRRIRDERQLANQFMGASVGQALNNALQGVRTVPAVDQQITSRLNTLMLMAQQYQAFGQGYMQQEIFAILTELTNIAERLRGEKNADDASKVLKLRDILQKFLAITQRHDDVYEGPPLYFGGSLSAAGILDFMIWQRKADELGIYLSVDDVKDRYRNEVLDLVTRQDDAAIQQYVFQRHGGTTARLLSALGEEFRVRMAQAALVGYSRVGIIQPPALVSPYDVWQYYERNRTEVTVDVLPLAVERFMDKAKSPTEEELRSLFDKYKDDEYAPEQEAPGFKLPERLAIQWVGASPQQYLYRKGAANAILGLVAQIPANPLPAVGLLYAIDAEYQRSRDEYDNEKWNYFRTPAWTDADFRLSFYTYQTLHRPEAAASLLGKLMTATGSSPFSLAGQAPLLQAVSAFQGAAVAREQNSLREAVAEESRRSVPVGIALFAAGPGPLSGLTAAGIAYYASKLLQHLPLRVVQDDMTRKLQDNLAETLLTASLDSFKHDLEALKKGQADFVKKELGKYGWKHGSTQGADDRYRIADDPGMRPLAEAYLGKEAFGDVGRARQFADIFFTERGPQKTKLYQPAELSPGPSATEEHSKYLYWRTEQKAPQVPTFEQGRTQVEQAWRLQQARELARARADKIAEKCRDTKGNAIQCLADAAKDLGTQTFRLDSVARLKASPLARAGLGNQYEPFRIPEDKIRYPSADFVDRIVDDLTSKGDLIVLKDEPGRHYYVVALAQREPPSIREFRQASLRGVFAAEQQRKYRQEVRDFMRKKAGFWINPGFQKDFDRSLATPDEG